MILPSPVAEFVRIPTAPWISLNSGEFSYKYAVTNAR
jgi:hypothetical protein